MIAIGLLLSGCAGRGSDFLLFEQFNDFERRPSLDRPSTFAQSCFARQNSHAQSLRGPDPAANVRATGNDSKLVRWLGHKYEQRVLDEYYGRN